MWATIAKRHHSVLKIFPFGAGSNDFMLYGEADFVSTTGQESAKQWAAHAELAEDASGELKFKLYHVYVVRLRWMPGATASFTQANAGKGHCPCSHRALSIAQCRFPARCLARSTVRRG